MQKVKNVCAYSPHTCFVAVDNWFLAFSLMLKSCLMQLYVGPCHVVSAGITVAMAVPIESPADCEVRGVIRFKQADDILGYFAEEVSSRVELLCCTTMDVRILPGRHKPCFVSNSIGTSSSILRTVRTCHHRTFSFLQKWRSTLLVNASQIMKKWRKLSWPGWMTIRPHGKKRVYTNWCQGTSALMSKATMWISRQRYVPKLVGLYSVSVLLIKHIFVWRNVFYFMDGTRMRD